MALQYKLHSFTSLSDNGTDRLKNIKYKMTSHFLPVLWIYTVSVDSTLYKARTIEISLHELSSVHTILHQEQDLNPTRLLSELYNVNFPIPGPIPNSLFGASWGRALLLSKS